MAHTTKINETVFIHDGDFGDDIEIRVGTERLTIPSADLKGFMAHWVRIEKCIGLENASDDEVLGLPNDATEPKPLRKVARKLPGMRPTMRIP